MNGATKSWSLSSIVLAVAGMTLVFTGLYFILLRPPLLPEDIRYMRLSPSELDAIGPRLAAWLTQVFRVMGGYIFATGVLNVTLAATSFRERRLAAVVGVTIGGAASIGLMAVVNFVIDSNFKWILLVMALPWAFSLCLLAFERKAPFKSAAGESQSLC
jgi:type IV secretory pathway VirB3-like protein